MIDWIFFAIEWLSIDQNLIITCRLLTFSFLLISTAWSNKFHLHLFVMDKTKNIAPSNVTCRCQKVKDLDFIRSIFSINIQKFFFITPSDFFLPYLFSNFIVRQASEERFLFSFYKYFSYEALNVTVTIRWVCVHVYSVFDHRITCFSYRYLC